MSEEEPKCSLKRSASDDLDGVTKTKRLNSSETSADTKPKELSIFSIVQKQGERDEQQDRETVLSNFDCGVSNVKRSSLVCLFDGHAGSRASEFCKSKFHVRFQAICQKYSNNDLPTLEKNMKKVFNETYKSVDDEKPAAKDGSTATTLLLLNNVIYCANIGDSKAVVCRSEDDKQQALQLTVDHQPMNFEERQRIQKAGGNVSDGRLLGMIEVSRAFGDGHLKAHGLISVPSVKKLTLTSTDLFLIVACDGLWKVFTSNDAVNYVWTQYLQMRKKSKDTQKIFDEIADALVTEAIDRKCGDNVSVIIIAFVQNLNA
ncbi:Phosphatase 2C containing protein [Aphelenchoides besseyi]|nr:Phosphatase 2C containing protein [Aphelenchoides besseyi]